MDPELRAFLRSHTPLVEASAAWAGGTLPLRITGYLGAEFPPLEYVTSVRGVIFLADQVLVVRDPDGVHVLPGGRREEGETLEETLRREVLEETGWTLRAPAPLGFTHFHHLSSKPAEYAYPHPDFLQVIFRAEAGERVPEAMQAGGWELGSEFQPVTAVRMLRITDGERLFLEAALQSRGV
jgi:8-oxo-dGTP pyrophosphatase MutT (NUDIX family)